MAPRRSKTDPLLKSAESGSHPSLTIDEDSAPAGGARNSPNSRQMSLKQLAAFLNRDRNTVMKYLDQGMPSVEQADRDRGIAWVIDSAEAVRWLEERAARNVAEKLGGDTKSVTKDEAERRDWVARMVIREKDAAESIGMVAKIHDMLDLMRQDYVELTLRLGAIPDTIAGKVDSKISARVRAIADEQIQSALKALVAVDEAQKRHKG
ncbi:terminase small subunit [Hoeflea olei]|nr:terminase small subunit [Hoeflea olei]